MADESRTHRGGNDHGGGSLSADASLGLVGPLSVGRKEETLILATRGTDSDDPPLTFENSNDRGLTRYELKRVPDLR